MSVSTEIARIQTARNTLRTKGVELGITLGTDQLDDIATKYDEGLVNQGSVSATVQEGETYNIPAGYHNGTGTVSGIAGGGNYTLQSKTATPKKATQAIVSDDGYYGLSDVTVNPIPAAYQDVTAVTAVASEVLANKVIVSSTGVVTAGTMVNNGAVEETLDTTTTEYEIPIGYHNGTGTVSIALETKTATPTTSAQSITPTSGKVLSGVTVNAIPTQYKDTSNTDAIASEVLSGKVVVTTDGEVTGTMPNNGTVTKILNTTTTSVYIEEGYHDGDGSVSIALETKSATPTTSAQTITPTSGKVLSSVSVAAIPTQYQDTTNADVVAGDILVGKVAVTASGDLTGTMPNNGTITTTFDGLTVSSYAIPAGYHSGSGTVSLTNDIENALSAI